MVQSAQDFIRALKAPSDPPHADGPTKIEIAGNAWGESSFYIPNKEEVITDWVLTRLLKDKDKDKELNPVFDLRYWSLLRDVLSAPSHATGTLRSTKAWLIPLLSRIPIAPILTSLLTHLSRNPFDDENSDLSSIASQCICILWPLAVPKLSADTLLDVFGAALGVFKQIVKVRTPKSHDENLIRLVSSIVTSYTSSAINAGNRKKLYSNFKEHYLRTWLETTVLEPGQDSRARSLSQAIYDAGIETIFNVEILRVERDGSFVEGALTKLTGEITDVVLQSLPRLFVSYSQNTRKYRGALYGQGSHQGPGASLQHARKAGMMFFACCDVLLGRTNSSELWWQTRIDLLRGLDSEGLYTMNDENAANVLRSTGESAVEALTTAIRDNIVTQGDFALSVVSIIVQIDYDLLASPLTIILPKLLLWPNAPHSAQTLLHQVMEFHTKIRTMDDFAEVCLQACTRPDVQTISTNVRTLYASVLSSPLLTRTCLDELSRYLRNFLTPGQVRHVVQNVVSAVSDTLEEFKRGDTHSLANEGEGPRKKRKSEGSNPLPPDYHALSLALMSSLASVVLSSVPLHSLQQDIREEVKQVVDGFYVTLKQAVKEGLKRVRSEHRQDTWGWQVVLSSILHLQYRLGGVPQLYPPPSNDEKVYSRMVTLLKSESVLPELRLEAYRMLLHAISQGFIDPVPVFDYILDTIGRPKKSLELGWIGHLHSLEEQQLPVALFYVLMERWLPLFDSSASDAQLSRLTEFLARISVDVVATSSEAPSLTLVRIWRGALGNAEFWELHRMRDALLLYISEHSAEIPLAALYGLLLWMPIEYLSRSTRSELLKRGVAADLAGQATNIGSQDIELISVLREFLRRTFLHMGAADHMSAGEYLTHLMSTPAISSKTSIVTTVTLELIRMHITHLLRAAARGDDESLKQLVASFSQSANLDMSLDQAASHRREPQSLVAFIDILTTEFNLHDFKAPCIEAVTGLCNQMASAAYPRMKSLIYESLPDMLYVQLSLTLYHRFLLLRRWLQSIDEHPPHFGNALASRVISTVKDASSDAGVFSALLAITQEELYTVSENDRAAHLQCLIALSLLMHRLSSPQGHNELDTSMSKFCRNLSSTEYTTALDFVWEGLSDVTIARDDVVNLVRLSSLLMYSSPEGSLKVTQGHWSRCLALFADRPQFLEEPALTAAVLELIAKKVNDRPASLRQQDLSSLWSVLGSCLAGSSQRCGTTSHQIYRELVSVISALIRLRRDLMVSTLPHLGIILRRLILCLKHLQPQLGAKQSRMVASSLPKWISLSTPLAAEDAKAVARLLTTLTTKTVVRTYSTSTSAQKAESLARPFSKHAAYVLSAYIDALNDPLSFIPSDIRRELQPGLFALCEMMGEQNRDSIMSTFDAGGKTVMKTLWREYEKQRYIGKG